MLTVWGENSAVASFCVGWIQTLLHNELKDCFLPSLPPPSSSSSSSPHPPLPLLRCFFSFYSPFFPSHLPSAFSTLSFLSIFSFFPLLSSLFPSPPSSPSPTFLSFFSLLPSSPSSFSHLCHSHYPLLVLLQDPDAAQIQSSIPSSDCLAHDPYPMPELSLPCTAEAAFAEGRPQSVPAEGWWCGDARSTFEGSSLQVPRVFVARISPIVTLHLLLECLRFVFPGFTPLRTRKV